MYPLPDFSCISIYIICMICITHTYIINTHIHIHVYTHMHYTKVVSYCIYCSVICFYHLIAYCKQFSMSIIVFTQHHNRQQEQKCKPTPSPPGVTAWTLWDPTFRSHLLLTDGESTNKRLALGNVPVLSEDWERLLSSTLGGVDTTQWDSPNRWRVFKGTVCTKRVANVYDGRKIPKYLISRKLHPACFQDRN